MSNAQMKKKIRKRIKSKCDIRSKSLVDYMVSKVMALVQTAKTTTVPCVIYQSKPDLIDINSVIVETANYILSKTSTHTKVILGTY